MTPFIIPGLKRACALTLWLILSHGLAVAQEAPKSLLEAAKTGDVSVVNALVAAKADLNQTDPKGRTSLMLAVMGGHSNVVGVLLDAGADVSATDNSGATAQDLARKMQNQEIGSVIADFSKRSAPEAAFKEALKKGDIDGIKRALESGVDVNLRLREGATPLMVAASIDPRKGLPLLRLLLDKGASVNAVDDRDDSAINRARIFLQADADPVLDLLKSKGAVPNASKLNDSLRRAIEEKDFDLVKALLGKKADPNHVGQYKSTTVLMEAAESGQKEIVEALLEDGANPDVKTVRGDADDTLGRTALFFAIQGGHAEVVRTLIEKKANVDARTKGGTTPLMLATWEPKRLEAAKLLLAAGANPSAKAKDGRTPLLIASGNGNNYQTVKLLLDAGADVTATTKENGDVLSVAAASGDTETTKILLTKPFVQRSKDIALMRAADGGRLEVAKLLLQNGADPNARLSDGRTAIQLAAARGHETLISLLAQAGAKVRPEGYETPTGQLNPAPGSTNLTMAEWENLIAPFNANGFGFKGKLLSEEGFKNKFGQPAETQKFGEQAMWYYKCSDGLIQLVIEAAFIEQQGVVIKDVNEQSLPGGPRPASAGRSSSSSDDGQTRPSQKSAAAQNPTPEPQITTGEAAPQIASTPTRQSQDQSTTAPASTKDTVSAALQWAKTGKAEAPSPQPQEQTSGIRPSSEIIAMRRQVDELLADSGTPGAPRPQLNPALWKAAGGPLDVLTGVKVFLEQGAEVNSADPRGNTALILAAQKGHSQVAKYLLTKGADVGKTNRLGQTAMDVAKDEEMRTVLKEAPKKN